MVDQSLELKVKSNTYKIDDLRIGKFIDYERMKASLSGGMYGSMFRMGTLSGDEALTMIDIEAFFTVFCPQVLKDLKCESFKDLGLKDYKEIKTVYVEKIVPWYNQNVEVLSPKREQKEQEGDDEVKK